MAQETKKTKNRFLTETEKYNVSKWKYSVEDNSISTKYLGGFWRYLETLFPAYVAANTISIVGFLIIVYSFYLCYSFHHLYPRLIECFVILSAFVYVNLDAIDGIHARRTKNASPMGELIDHVCDSGSTMFVTLSFCHIFGISNPATQWHLVQTTVMGFQYCHYLALIGYPITFGKFTGPVEILAGVCGVILMKTLGFIQADSLDFIEPYSQYLYLTGSCLSMGSFVMHRKSHQPTTNGLLITYGLLMIQSFTLQFVTINLFHILSAGCVMSMITCDLIVSKMAKKELSQWMVTFALLSGFNSFVGIGVSLVYIIGVIYEISEYLRIDIFMPRITVYCCGVFDMCHFGHMAMFENAALEGTNLIVGVHNDAEVESYKRTPTMTHEERCKAVSRCKFVNRVVPDASLFVTEEFIKEHDIHIVVCAEEYFNNPDDKWYKAPRDMGILRMIPYSSGISTSDLMKRIIESYTKKQVKAD